MKLPHRKYFRFLVYILLNAMYASTNNYDEFQNHYKYLNLHIDVVCDSIENKRKIEFILLHFMVNYHIFKKVAMKQWNLQSM